jgi:hypothetical protein
MQVKLKKKELSISEGLFTSVVYIKGENIPLEVGREVTKFLKNFH